MGGADPRRARRSVLDPLRFRRQTSEQLWLEADRARSAGNRSGEDAIYRYLARRRPTSAADHMYAGLACFRRQQPAAAIEAFEAGLGAHPGDDALLGSYAYVCAMTGSLGRALDRIGGGGSDRRQTCADLFERVGDPDFRVQLLALCCATGDVRFATERVDAMLRTSASTEALWQLADVLIDHRCHHEATEIYRHLAQIEPADPTAFLHSALAKHRLHDLDGAAELLERGLTQHPGSSRLLEHHVRISLELGRIDRVMAVASSSEDQEEVYEALFDRFPDIEVRLNLIDHILGAGYEELAARSLEALRSQRPDSRAAWRIADFLAARGRAPEAREVYQRLAALRPQSEDDHYFSGLAWSRLGDDERCLQLLEQGLRAHPSAADLPSLYLQVCAGLLEHERYFAFVGRVGASVDRPASELEFYLEASRLAPHDFLLSWHDLEVELDPTSFAAVVDGFVDHLGRHPQAMSTVKRLIFFCRLLDLDARFCSRVREALVRSSCRTDTDVRSAAMLDELTPPLIPRSGDDRQRHLLEFIAAAERLAADPVSLGEPITDMTGDWMPWQHVFCLAAPELYGRAIAAFERLAMRTWPRLDHTAAHVQRPSISPRPLRVGFMVHDSMPMMSGLLDHLDGERFETVFLRPGRAGASPAAADWIARADRTVECSDRSAHDAIEVIASEELDIIVSGPSVASVFYPMMARLAPLQMVLLEPNWTDGFRNADYYISWAAGEPSDPGRFYSTSVALTEHPPYWIERPARAADPPLSREAREAAIQRLTGLDPATRVYLCANTPPKVHPDMDDLLRRILERDRSGVVVLLRREFAPARVLRARLRDALAGDSSRLISLPTLSSADAHLLLQSVDCCLDSLPICGMSSSFDGAMLGVPAVTLPSDVPFGRWTAAIYDQLGVSDLTARDHDEYVDIAVRLANDQDWRERLGREIRRRSERFVEREASAVEFRDFLLQAWERRAAGRRPADWIGGRWRERPS